MLDLKFCLSILLGIFLTHAVTANVTRSDAVSIFETHLKNSNYDKYTRPSTGDSLPIDIKVSIYLARSRSICQKDSSWKAELYLKQRWLDERLKYPDTMGDVSVLPADRRLVDLIWTPATYLAEASVESREPSVYVKVGDDGSVTKTTRIEGVIPCVFNLTFHPNQVAICSLKITNFDQSGMDVSYSWDQAENSVTTKRDVLNLGAYKFNGQILKFSEIGTEKPSILTADLVFERNVGLDCRLILLPIVILVGLALTALYVPAEHVGCRFALSVVSLTGGIAILMYYVDRIAKGGPISNVENFLYGCLVAIGLTVFDHFLVSIRALLRVKEEVTYVEASNTRSYLSQCTPEPKESKCHRCRYASRKGCLFLVAVLDYLVRVATPVAFGAFLFCFCQQWCHNQNDSIPGLEMPVIKYDNVVTPAIL